MLGRYTFYTLVSIYIPYSYLLIGHLGCKCHSCAAKPIRLVGSLKGEKLNSHFSNFIPRYSTYFCFLEYGSIHLVLLDFNPRVAPKTSWASPSFNAVPHGNIVRLFGVCVIFHSDIFHLLKIRYFPLLNLPPNLNQGYSTSYLILPI